MRQIINEYGSCCGPDQLKDAIEHDETVEEIKELLTTWETNGNILDLIEPQDGLPHHATHIYKENNITVYLKEKDNQIIIVHATFPVADAA